MCTFYFVSVLLLFQVCYGLHLSGFHCAEYPYVDAIIHLVVHSGFVRLSRLVLILYFFFFSKVAFKDILQKCRNKSWFIRSIFTIWLIILIVFVCFDLLLFQFVNNASVFWLLFCFSFGPFLFFNKHKPGVSEDKIEFKRPKNYQQSSVFSIALKTTHGLLPINNPQRGILVMGSAGSGKTRYMLEPILYAMIKKGYCGLLYDYDFEATPGNAKKNYCLSKFVYNCYLQLKDEDKRKFSFRIINFTDPNKSVRVNPIDPMYISNRSYLEEYVTVLLNNLNPAKKEDFWHLSSKSLLKGLLVYLSNNAKSCCTLPHVLMLITKPIDQVLSLIEQDKEAYTYASSIFDAMRGGQQAMAQLIGIVASLKVSLQPLLNRELFWVLSGHELSLDINHASAPTLLCVGNFPPAKSAFSPVIALLISVCCKSMYGHGKVKSFVCIDELPTLYIPNFAELPATARKYGMATIGCVQSVAQLEKTYSVICAKEIQENLSNQFIGNCGVYSARYGSSIFGKASYFVRSKTASTSYPSQAAGTNETVGESVSLHEKECIPSQDFSGLEVGSFVGKVVESDAVFFKEQFLGVADYDKRFKNEHLKDIPDVRNVTPEDLLANERKIEADINILLENVPLRD